MLEFLLSGLGFKLGIKDASKPHQSQLVIKLSLRHPLEGPKDPDEVPTKVESRVSIVGVATITMVWVRIRHIDYIGPLWDGRFQG